MNTTKKKKYERACPICGNLIGYVSRYNRSKAEKKGTICRLCDDKNRSKRMMGSGNPFFGKTHSKKTIAKIQENRDLSSFKTKEFRDKMSQVTSGRRNPMHGKTVYGVWVEKYGEKEANRKMVEAKKKWSKSSSGKNNPMYGKPSPQGSGNGWSGWYKGWFFRSLKELSYMINVIEANDYKWRTAETNDLAITYTNYDGTERTYRADFLVEEEVLVEVKPIKLFSTPTNKLKKKAAMAFCKKNGYKYSVVDVKLLDMEAIELLRLKGIITFTKTYEEKWRNFYESRRRTSNCD